MTLTLQVPFGVFNKNLVFDGLFIGHRLTRWNGSLFCEKKKINYVIVVWRWIDWVQMKCLFFVNLDSRWFEWNGYGWWLTRLLKEVSIVPLLFTAQVFVTPFELWNFQHRSYWALHNRYEEVCDRCALGMNFTFTGI